MVKWWYVSVVNGATTVVVAAQLRWLGRVFVPVQPHLCGWVRVCVMLALPTNSSLRAPRAGAAAQRSRVSRLPLLHRQLLQQRVFGQVTGAVPAATSWYVRLLSLVFGTTSVLSTLLRCLPVFLSHP